jgi:hypothetical protein
MHWGRYCTMFKEGVTMLTNGVENGGGEGLALGSD